MVVFVGSRCLLGTAPLPSAIRRERANAVASLGLPLQLRELG